MKTESRKGDQFATRGELIENKAMRIDETNKANGEQALRFARTPEEERDIKLGTLQGRQRAIAAREIECGDAEDDAEGDAEPDVDQTDDPTTETD